ELIVETTENVGWDTHTGLLRKITTRDHRVERHSIRPGDKLAARRISSIASKAASLTPLSFEEFETSLRHELCETHKLRCDKCL
ncbi:MAG: hypothetical protein ACK50P_03220, partial [Planctomycetaceae bacterium]